jgi:hypothetical protein
MKSFLQPFASRLLYVYQYLPPYLRPFISRVSPGYAGLTPENLWKKYLSNTKTITTNAGRFIAVFPLKPKAFHPR